MDMSGIFVNVIIEDQDGEKFTYSRPELEPFMNDLERRGVCNAGDFPIDTEEGEGYFSGNLGHLMTEQFGKRAAVKETIRLEGVDCNSRFKNIEYLQVGDSVFLVPTKNIYGMECIEVKKGEYSIGYIPWEQTEVVYYSADKKEHVTEKLAEVNDLTAEITKVRVGPHYSIYSNGYSDGYVVEIGVNLRTKAAANVFQSNDVGFVCDYLTEHTRDRREEYFDEKIRQMRAQQVKKDREDFKTKVMEKIKDTSQIRKITVIRTCMLSGGCKMDIVRQDQRLHQYAGEYLAAEGEEKEKAAKRLINYIRTPKKSRESNFHHIDDLRYGWNGNTKQLAELSQCICADAYSAEYEEEYIELNAETGEISHYAILDLDWNL